jgi:hypothetical protein
MAEASHNDDDNSHDVEEEFEEDLEDDDISEEEEEWQDTNPILNYELIFVYGFLIKPFCHSLHSYCYYFVKNNNLLRTKKLQLL